MQMVPIFWSKKWFAYKWIQFSYLEKKIKLEEIINPFTKFSKLLNETIIYTLFFEMPSNPNLWSHILAVNFSNEQKIVF